MSKYYNPFQAMDLRYPKQFRDEVERYTQRWADGGEPGDPDDSPFPRMVDMWLLAVCIGAGMGRRTPMSRDDSHKFVEGSIFQSDPWRVEVLELLAIGFSNDPQVIRNPREVMQLANELAATGMGRAIEMLKDGHAGPIWNVSDAILERLEALAKQ